MEARKITVVETRNQSKKVIMSAATTLAELKRDFDANGIDYTDMAFYEGVSHTELKTDESVLPHDVPYRGTTTNELVFMLTTANKKIKSGAMTRKEIIATIKEKGLQQVVKDTFGKNFTNCTTSDLETLLKKEEEIVSPEDQDNNYTENKEEYGLYKAFEYLVGELLHEDTISEEVFNNVHGLLHHTDVKITKKPSLESKYSDDDIEEMFAGMIQ